MVLPTVYPVHLKQKASNPYGFQWGSGRSSVRGTPADQFLLAKSELHCAFTFNDIKFWIVRKLEGVVAPHLL